ncbi:MAG: hypothetical protein ABSG98_08100 [Anaerolineales bacterium]|jgi:hypothetical protein
MSGQRFESLRVPIAIDSNSPSCLRRFIFDFISGLSGAGFAGDYAFLVRAREGEKPFRTEESFPDSGTLLACGGEWCQGGPGA